MVLRCRSNEVLKLWDASTNAQMVVEMPMKWYERIHAQLTEWITMSQCIDESMSQWIDEVTKQWTNESDAESTNQLTNQSTNQSINQSVNQGNKEAMNQWSNKAMNQWINEWAKYWVDAASNQWSTEATKHWVNERINEAMHPWINQPMNQRISESIIVSMNQWISKSMNHWTNRPMSQWTNEWMNQRTNESMNQCINESVNQRINEPMNQWIIESINQWMNKWMSQWVDKRMNWGMGGWIDEWVANCFVEPLLVPLLSAISFLSRLLSGILLLWSPSILSCLPATWFVASAHQFFSSLRAAGTMPFAIPHMTRLALCSKTTFRAAVTIRLASFSNIQLQSRLPGAWQHDLGFAACSRANAFCRSQLQPCVAEASRQVDQPSRSAGDSTPLRTLRFFVGVFFCEIGLSLQSLRRPQEPLYLRKTQGFAPESVFTAREFTRFGAVTLLYCSQARNALAHYVVDMVMLTWGRHDDKTAPAHLSVTWMFSN